MTMIKSILLPFNNVLPTAVAINAARTLGQQFESYIEGAFCRQLLPVIAGEGITLPGDYLAEFEEEGRRQSEEARDVFFQLIGEVDIPVADLEEATVGLRAGWTEMVGTGTGGVAEYARLFDLSIVARPDDEVAIEWKSTIEALLFESGRPILLVGDEVPSVVGDRVVVAWNRSVEGARSVVMSAALLPNSSEVVVVTVAGATVPGPARVISTRGLKPSNVAKLRLGARCLTMLRILTPICWSKARLPKAVFVSGCLAELPRRLFQQHPYPC